MASKLEDLCVTKVDFVDAGANPEANIVLFKRAPDGGTDAEAGKSERPGFLRNVLKAIAKSFGATEAQVSEAMAEITKGEAVSFGEKMNERKLRRISDEIWDYCYALQESLCSILRDENVPAEEKPAHMTRSVTEFVAAVNTAIPKWSSGTPISVEKSVPAPMTEERLLIAKEAKARLDQLIEGGETADTKTGDADSTPGGEDNPSGTVDTGAETNTTAKGADEMNIDKSKLNTEELAALDAIEKKAGIPEETDGISTTGDVVTKSVEVAQEAQSGEAGDIYKGLHPAVAQELQALRKFREDAENREILNVAKKYALLGKKPEELAAVLKSLKAAGGSAYADMIGVLDANLAVMESSPAFTEIGKRGGAAGSNDANEAWAMIEKKAQEIRKGAPAMSYAEAVDLACTQNPDLVRQYESAR